MLYENCNNRPFNFIFYVANFSSNHPGHYNEYNKGKYSVDAHSFYILHKLRKCCNRKIFDIDSMASRYFHVMDFSGSFPAGRNQVGTTGTQARRNQINQQHPCPFEKWLIYFPDQGFFTMNSLYIFIFN